MKYLFTHWENIQAKIRHAKSLFLFLDYDGTLTPIVSRPDLARCPSEVRRRLEELRDFPGIHLAIISGRSLEDVRKKVGVSGITYVGNHGLEIENPAGWHKKILVPAREKQLKKIAQNLQNSLKEIPGILLEDKGLILSVHYRNVPPKCLKQIPRAVEAELQRWGNCWKTRPGKMVLEIQPNIDFGKGKVVKEILRTHASQTLLPVYLGDDLTDEDAFRVLKGQGISVFVGPGRFPSKADFFLQNPDEVQEFLVRLVKARRNCSESPGVT